MRPALRWLYLLNACVLITHEIDSAYWHEWELFRLPGGIQAFLFINGLLVALVLYGYQAVIRGSRGAITYSWVLAAAGLFAAIIHTVWLVGGDRAFRLPVSLALLTASGILSMAQAATLMSTRSADKNRALRAG